MGLLSKGKQSEQQTDSSEIKNQPSANPKKSTVVTAEKKPKGISQKDAVFNEVKKILAAAKINVSKGKAISTYLTKDHRKAVVDALVTGFKNKQYPLKDTEGNRKKLADDKLLRAYVIGLLKNWLERDQRLQNQEGEFLQ
jgi:hypothetical protein